MIFSLNKSIFNWKCNLLSSLVFIECTHDIYKFPGFGLRDLLHNLQDEAKENDRLSIQLKLFDDYGQKERRHMASTMADNSFLDDVNFDDPYDLFDALMHKVSASLFYPYFLPGIRRW